MAECASEWELTQSAAEWLAARCRCQVAALYLSDERQGQVRRGLSGDAGAVDMAPSRLWCKGGTGWTAADSESLLVVQWAMGTVSGLVLVGPFPPGARRPRIEASVEAAVRELIVPLIGGLQRYGSMRSAEANLMEAVAFQAGAGLGAPDALVAALKDETLAHHAEIADNRIVLSDPERESSAVVAAVERWLPLLSDTGSADERTLVTLFALADLVDARAPETTGRSLEVAEWAVRIGNRLGLTQDELMVIREVARLSRVGAALTGAGLPGGPVNRSSLAAVSASLLAGAGRPAEVVDAVALGAERWDGLGSKAVEGTDIPFAARIVAVASAWVDRTGGQPWAEAVNDELAARSIVAAACRQYDPLVVSALLEESDASAAV